MSPVNPADETTPDPYDDNPYGLSHTEPLPDPKQVAPEFAPVGWERRSDGGKFFTPGKRHLYDASQDLDALPELRTLCGTAVPKEVLRFLRNGRSRSAFATISTMREQELAADVPCARCERAVARR